MTTDDRLATTSQCPLCISCLATITAALKREDLLALFAGDVESRVDTCAACKRSTRMTYRFTGTLCLAA
jgi:hypothetical protein